MACTVSDIRAAAIGDQPQAMVDNYGNRACSATMCDVRRVADQREIVRRAYRAFNAGDVDAAIELTHPDVDWPNAWEGGRVVGHAAVRDYWSRQFDAISSEVEPQSFAEEPDGAIVVEVHQVVREADFSAA